MDLGLQDRVAIVAASSQGLAKAVALGLAREGANVALCARNEAVVRATAEQIAGETGVKVLAGTLDVTSEQDVNRFVADVQSQLGRVNICVTNAGGPPSKSFAETSIEDWRRTADLNLMSTVFFAKATLPLMQARHWGRFIAITSMTVKQPVEGLILSNSIRSAVVGLVKTLSNEYGRDNILVNNVCPGYTGTDRLLELGDRIATREGITREQVTARWASQVPLGRIGEPEEFANLVVFLASERASYITGASITVDGGFVKGVL